MPIFSKPPYASYHSWGYASPRLPEAPRCWIDREEDPARDVVRFTARTWFRGHEHRACVELSVIERYHRMMNDPVEGEYVDDDCTEEVVEYLRRDILMRGGPSLMEPTQWPYYP